MAAGFVSIRLRQPMYSLTLLVWNRCGGEDPHQFQKYCGYGTERKQQRNEQRRRILTIVKREVRVIIIQTPQIRIYYNQSFQISKKITITI